MKATVSAMQPSQPSSGESFVELGQEQLTALAFQKGGCAACHIIPGVPGANGTVGPDLSAAGDVAVWLVESGGYTGSVETGMDYIRESILDPEAYISQNCSMGPCQPGVMPVSFGDVFGPDELDRIVEYLTSLPGGEMELSGGDVQISAPVLTDEEFGWAKQTFFERCAGCHGTLRNGATGPALTPDVTLPQGTLALSSIIYNGTPKGMPDWGKQGFFTQEETDLMAKYLQNEPPNPPELSLQQMLDT